MHSSDLQANSKNMFTPTTYNHIIRPVGGKFIFINQFYGNIIATCESNVLSMPSAIIMNPVNNVIFQRFKAYFIFTCSRIFLYSILITSGQYSDLNPKKVVGKIFKTIFYQ